MESDLNNLKAYRKWLEENGAFLNNVRKKKQSHFSKKIKD